MMLTSGYCLPLSKYASKVICEIKVPVKCTTVSFEDEIKLFAIILYRYLHDELDASDSSARPKSIKKRQNHSIEINRLNIKQDMITVTATY